MWWSVTENGRRMPLDRTPHEHGNVVVVGTVSKIDTTPLVHVLTNVDRAEGTYDGRDRFFAHKATCGKTMEEVLAKWTPKQSNPMIEPQQQTMGL